MTGSRFIVRLAFGCLCLVLACRESVGPKKPVPGNLYVRLQTPNATDAAIRLTLTGPQIGALAAAGDRLLFSLPVDATSRKVAVFGDLGTGDIFSFAVPDVNRADLYAVTLVQVATTTNALRVPLTGYTFVVHD